MADYPISKEAVVRELIELRDTLGGPFAKEIMNMALAKLEGFQRMDAVPVVRCRDCILRKTSGCPMKTSGTGAYIGHGMYDEGSDKTKDNGFCHKGKRREYT